VELKLRREKEAVLIPLERVAEEIKAIFPKK
jgi:hypothetical protein